MSDLVALMRYRWTYVPALSACAIVVVWWLVCGALKIVAVEPRLWLIGWVAIFSPLEVLAVYVRFFYRDDEDYTPTKSAFDAAAEASA